jgi:hypothetical protein
MSSQNPQVVMIGSVPMSLEELPLAPALISARVKNRGYDFKFIDINLELFDRCNKNLTLYQEKTELIQNFTEEQLDDVITPWLDWIAHELASAQCVLINVFSQFSHGASWHVLQRIQQHQSIKIVGGIGSQKLVGTAQSSGIDRWLKQNFADVSDLHFGALLINNHMIQGWQQDTTMSEIDRLLPARLRQGLVPEPDFTIFDLDRYQWPVTGKSVPILGSHGCVRQCSFCDVIKHFPSYSFVEADQLSQQIVSVYQQTGIEKFIFMDSLVNGSMRNFESLLQNLAHSKQQGWLPENFSWSGTYICRPPSTQLSRIHQLLKPAGVDNLTIGVETGSDRVRFDMDKKFTNDDLVQELRAFSKHGVKAQLLFFSGWPTETQADFSQTLELFDQLAPLAQTDTVNSMSLGTSGFALIDGTPIYQKRQDIGLEPGPLTFLWQCSTNPELNFWAMLKRRLAMAALANYHGINIALESTFLRYLIFNLSRYQDVIRDYAGPLQESLLDHSQMLSQRNNQHTIEFTVINSGTSQVNVAVNDELHQCQPGFTQITVNFTRHLMQSQTIDIDFVFERNHCPQWDLHPGGEYFSRNGLYLDNIMVDQRDITLWGFNQMFDQTVDFDVPDDFYRVVSQRCVSGNSHLRCEIPVGVGLQEHIHRATNKEIYTELDFTKQKLSRVLLQYQN